MDMTGIQSLLVRIYGYDDSKQHPWGIVKVIGESEEHHFHNQNELLKLLLADGEIAPISGNGKTGLET